MNIQKTLTLLALALALVIAAAPANAQQLYKGTFTLPFEAQFGSNIVEAGQYTITVEEALGQRMIRLYGQSTNGPSGFAVLTGSTDRVEPAANGKLKFVDVNGIPTLKSFQAGVIGQLYTFVTPKSKGGESAHAGAESLTTEIVATR
jgi:hypothetical protein